jgi:hypothetical protein
MTRHQSITDLMQFFSYEHLKEGTLRDTSQKCHNLALEMYSDENLDGPELTVGLRKLLEAKDCFVRAALS